MAGSSLIIEMQRSLHGPLRCPRKYASETPYGARTNNDHTQQGVQVKWPVLMKVVEAER